MLQTKSRQNNRGGFYWTCPECGAHLDSGERCSCRAEKTERDEAQADQAEILKMITEFLSHEQ